jgi:hypothetical protein
MANVSTLTCWICGKALSLESCKIDEHGQPVHEECYVAVVRLRSGSRQQASHPTVRLLHPLHR